MGGMWGLELLGFGGVRKPGWARCSRFTVIRDPLRLLKRVPKGFLYGSLFRVL